MLAQLWDAGTTRMSVGTVARGFVHLHCDRLGVDSDTERIVLGLLRRVRLSLDVAPTRAYPPA